MNEQEIKAIADVVHRVRMMQYKALKTQWQRLLRTGAVTDEDRVRSHLVYRTYAGALDDMACLLSEVLGLHPGTREFKRWFKWTGEPINSLAERERRRRGKNKGDAI